LPAAVSASLRLYAVLVHRLAGLTTLRSVHEVWLRNLSLAAKAAGSFSQPSFLRSVALPELASDDGFFIFMFGISTGILNPIYNVPMQGTHMVWLTNRQFRLNFTHRLLLSLPVAALLRWAKQKYFVPRNFSCRNRQMTIASIGDRKFRRFSNREHLPRPTGSWLTRRYSGKSTTQVEDDQSSANCRGSTGSTR
jgi:hypothetical protein